MYIEAMEVVCQKMGVHIRVDVEEGLNNAVLRKGCQKLGYSVEDIPRNLDAKHNCGWCCFGCKEGRKLATSETWLVDLVNSGNGVILPRCEAVRVMHQSKNGRKIAIRGCLRINGKGNMCSGIESYRSGLRSFKHSVIAAEKRPEECHIGKNLHLHLVTMAWGYFNEKVLKQKSYQGPIITAMTKVTKDESKDDGLYGAIIQTPSLHPKMFSSFMPWVSGSDLKRRMTRFSRTAHMFTLARDRGSGAVGDSSNSISYKMGESDERNLQKGVEKMLRILAAAGAEEIGTHNLGGRSINVKEARKEVERFVKEESRRPIRGLRTHLGSAHQMGSCPMGVDPAVSAKVGRAEKQSGEGGRR
ncbi:Long-chain-alcohol oxidase FAO4A [Linum grandiflorum]